MTNLKPCPFCKSRAVGHFPKKPSKRNYVECGEAGCNVAGPLEKTPEKAAYSWNHRPIEDALRERVKVLEGDLAAVKEFAESSARKGEVHMRVALLEIIKMVTQSERQRR